MPAHQAAKYSPMSKNIDTTYNYVVGTYYLCIERPIVVIIEYSFDHFVNHPVKLVWHISSSEIRIMKLLLLMWMSQYPDLINTERGDQQVIIAALQFTQDINRTLVPYERSLLERVARREMTLGHLLAYMREHEEA
jgi:hypothetical protein